MHQIGDMVNAGRGQEFRFVGDAVTTATSWKALPIPSQYTMAHILAIGPGGVGGNGAVGANSTAAGGGGGGSGAQTSVLIATKFLPDTLYISVPALTGQAVRVAVQPDNTANHCLAFANGGSSGGNASGATAGAAGAAAGVAVIGNMPLAGRGIYNLLAGQAGIIGGTTVSGGALTLPTTGLWVTGGTGGGGLPAAAAAGANGGAFTVPAGGFFPSQAGGAGGSSGTTPGAEGSHGFWNFNGLEYGYGGTGGGSSHGSAAGAGLVGGAGGRGAPGCGGGGGGGALTGSTQGIGGAGGPGLVIVTLW